MRPCVKNIIAALVLAVVPSVVLGAEPETRADLSVTDSAEIDNRPFLKKLFKDFPIVYTDTAYEASDYIFVIKCTLMNHSWHYHHGSKIKPEGDTAEVVTDDDVKPMVRFSNGTAMK